MQRTLASWERAKKANALHVEFLGVKEIKEAGGRACWILKRTGYASPEEKEGITGLTTYIDKDSWLQVGTLLKGEDNQLVGEYYFRDIKINPDFPADTFMPNALKR
jgi:outer membrane lipoprotein-sorting protein